MSDRRLRSTRARRIRSILFERVKLRSLLCATPDFVHLPPLTAPPPVACPRLKPFNSLALGPACRPGEGMRLQLNLAEAWQLILFDSRTSRSAADIADGIVFSSSGSLMM